MWYERHQRGLRFECTACSDCCRRPGGVILTPLDLLQLEEFLGEDFAALRRDHIYRDGDHWMLDAEEGRDCPLLDEAGLCQVHPAKPWQCRAYPFWIELVETREAWTAEATQCEGIGRGPRHSPERIAQWLNEDPLEP